MKLHLRWAALAALALVRPPSARADAPVCTQLDANTRRCHIDRPTVNQRVTAYPTVTFAAGDVVSVIAGGCVQTGGIGSTWKRYLDPRGLDSDERYFGTIHIPGVTGGQVRTASIVGRKYMVPAGIPASESYLRLGYDDDGYGDNGYTARDDGTCGQCTGEPDAWLDIVIQRNVGYSNPWPRDMDVFAWSNDANGFPLNGEWWKKLVTGVAPDVTQTCSDFAYQIYSDVGCNRFAPTCTSQAPDVDGPSSGNVPCALGRTGRVDGHVNYMPATYEGTVQWQDHATDGDDNFRLYPVGGAGLTGPQTAISVERSGDDVLGRAGSAWWQRFRGSDDAGKRALVDNKFAVVSGLLGFDCGHNPCMSELHPAYAMAIHVDDNPYDDQWALFVSNFGNEGFCAQDDHPLDLWSYTVRLPRATAGTTGTVAYDAVSVGGASTGGVKFVSGVGAELTFNLSAPANRGLTDGVAHIGWAPHPDYQTGARIPSAVTPCATKLATIDPYCVNTGWDSICAREARDQCPSHSVCTSGAALAKLDSACVTKVGNADPFCVNSGWDSICVSEAKSMCAYTCAAGAP